MRKKLPLANLDFSDTSCQYDDQIFVLIFSKALKQLNDTLMFEKKRIKIKVYVQSYINESGRSYNIICDLDLSIE